MLSSRSSTFWTCCAARRPSGIPPGTGQTHTLLSVVVCGGAETASSMGNGTNGELFSRDVGTERRVGNSRTRPPVWDKLVRFPRHTHHLGLDHARNAQAYISAIRVDVESAPGPKSLGWYMTATQKRVVYDGHSGEGAAI